MPSRMRHFLQGLLPLAGVCAGMVWLAFVCGEPLFDLSRHSSSTASLLTYASLMGLFSLQVFALVFETICWMRYRPVATRTDLPLPPLTVIIPAYNEGPMVERSIRSVAQSDYPAELLEILVVDDGSRDDTWFHMERLRREFPERVRLLRFKGNRGKRAGLYEGFHAAKGEVVVTLDSDSEVSPSTLRALVAPLVQDPRVGAVAGRVSVLDRSHLIGAMLDVQFTLAFDFARAAQSTFHTVWCCPGALSAVRKSVVLPHLDGWLDQRFLGRPVSHGEDQALTNIVLRAGYDTVYQRTAVVHTLTPRTYRQLYRMLLRWDRSWVVEAFSYGRFMFSEARRGRRILPPIHFALANLRQLTVLVGILALPFQIFERPGRVVDFSIALVLAAAVTAAYYLRTRSGLRFLYGVVYAVYAFLFLQWIFPWAVITVRDERWGTR